MNYLNYVALIIGIVTIGIGLLAMVLPKDMSKRFGIKVTGSGLSFVVATGARDVFMGFVMLILYTQKQMTLIAYVSMCIGAVAIIDFIQVLRHGDKKISAVHFVGAAIAIAYGVLLLKFNV